MRILVTALGCATFGHCCSLTTTINAIDPFPPSFNNWEYGTIYPVHSSPVGFRPDPVWYDLQSRRKYRFTPAKKHNFCGLGAAAASSFAKNLSSYTGNEAPFKAPEWGYIYSLSEKIFKETY